jgi:hypothetical protein
MTYSIKTNFGMWKIEPGPDGLWILKRKTKLRWKPVGIYKLAEEAAAAVATGITNERDWDERHHRPADFGLPKWDKDKTDLGPE